jgi:hypothetical protein
LILRAARGIYELPVRSEVDRALNFWIRQRATGRLPLPKSLRLRMVGVPSGDWLHDRADWKRHL